MGMSSERSIGTLVALAAVAQPVLLKVLGLLHARLLHGQSVLAREPSELAKVVSSK